MEWATSAVSGLWHFRTASHAFQNDNLLHLLDQSVRAQHDGATPWFDPEFFTTISFELHQGDEVALSFTLTEGERQIILDEVASDQIKHQIAALLEWWHGRSARSIPHSDGSSSTHPPFTPD